MVQDHIGRDFANNPVADNLLGDALCKYSTDIEDIVEKHRNERFELNENWNLEN